MDLIGIIKERFCRVTGYLCEQPEPEPKMVEDKGPEEIMPVVQVTATMPEEECEYVTVQRDDGSFDAVPLNNCHPIFRCQTTTPNGTVVDNCSEE